MPVKAAMGQPGRVHDRVHAHRVDAVLAEQPPGGIEDALRAFPPFAPCVLRICSIPVSHDDRHLSA